MEEFSSYLNRIEIPEHRIRMEALLRWVFETFPPLAPRIAWNQPMFTDHGTFIIGFSVAKRHIAVAPESAGMQRFSQEIQLAGYTQTKELFRIAWEDAVDHPLLERIIRFNMLEKADWPLFWRA